MSITELLLLAIGLSLDAFSVAVSLGLTVNTAVLKNSIISGLWFGGFQALMPILGFLLGRRFYNYVNYTAPYLSFVLLSLIGFNMIKEAIKKDDTEVSSSFNFKNMFVMAVATSIDALAVGITFAFLGVDILPAGDFYNILFAAFVIGIITFLMSFIGVTAGGIVGKKYKSKAEIFGGVILLIIAAKILLQHYGLI